MATKSAADATSPRPKARVLVPQLSLLLAAIENDPSLYNAANCEMITFLNVQKWFKLSLRLNDCFGGAVLSAQSWKVVMGYWSDSVKRGGSMSKDRRSIHKLNPSITRKEAKELTRLERRFYNLMKKEEAQDIVDVTYTGNFGAEEIEKNITGATDNGIKVKLQLINVAQVKTDENTNYPEGPKKRIIHVKEDDPTDPADVTKKLKIVFDEHFDEDSENKSLEHQLERLQIVSRRLEEHITTIQSRIHMIKDLWKHRCGDN